MKYFPAIRGTPSRNSAARLSLRQHAAVLGLVAFFGVSAAPGLAAGRSEAPTSGPYVGSSNQLCPSFAAASGECRSGERLPMSFTVSGNAVVDFRAVLELHCEEDLPPRLYTLEIHRPLLLAREARGHGFSTKHNWNAALRKSGAVGHVKTHVANGWVSAVTEAAPNAYCYARGVEWRATPR